MSFNQEKISFRNRTQNGRDNSYQTQTWGRGEAFINMFPTFKKVEKKMTMMMSDRLYVEKPK